MKNKQKKRKKKEKRNWWRKYRWIVYILIYVVFVIYSNIDLSEDRLTSHFESIQVGNETIIYNKTIMDVAQPLFYNRSNEKAILLLHGYGGTPYELKYLAEGLADNNISVFVPLLPRHGTTVEELSGLRWEEEYEAAEDYLLMLKKNYKEVYVGGLCNGGLLALLLSSNIEVDGIISMSAPIYEVNRFVEFFTSKPFLYVLRILTPYLRRIKHGVTRDPIAARKLPSFDRFSVNALITFEGLTTNVKKNLPKIKNPVLILQSTWDNRAAPPSGKYIYERVASTEKELIWLNNSGHVITLDYDKEIVLREVLDFVT